MALTTIEAIRIPIEPAKEEKLIRDANDKAIMRAAIASKADAALTGDKDFLESGIRK